MPLVPSRPPRPRSTSIGPARVPRTRISRLPKGKIHFWKMIEEQYCTNKLCDLQLRFQDSKNVIFCHKIVLASVSALIKRALLTSAEAEPGEKAVILITGLDYVQVREVVDFLYSFLAAGEAPVGYLLNKTALTALDIDLTFLADSRSQTSGAYAVKTEDRNWTTAISQEKLLNNNNPCVSKDVRMIADAFQPHVLLERLSSGKKTRKRIRGTILQGQPKKIPKTEVQASKNPLLCEDNLQKIMNNQGELNVTVLEKPMRYLKENFYWLPYKIEHCAILGVRNTPKGMDGLALTRKLKSGEDPYDQYKQTGEAFKSVLGFSTRDAFCHPIMCNKLDETRKNVQGNTKAKCVRDFARFSDEQLKSVVNRPEVVDIIQRQPSKDFTICPGPVLIEMNSKLRTEEMENLLMLFILDTGEIKARVCKILDVGVDKTVTQLHWSIFHVWALSSTTISEQSQGKITPGKGRTSSFQWTPVPRYMIESPQLKELYNGLLKTCIQFDVAQAYLSGEYSKERVLNKSAVCPKCGETFPLSTQNEESRYAQHQKMHYFEECNCECGIDFNTDDEKMWHHMLHHDKDKKYKKCDFCPFVHNTSMLKSHMKKYHGDDDRQIRIEELIRCELCSKTFYSQTAADEHNSLKHIFTCSICRGEFTSLNTLKDHVAVNHPGAQNFESHVIVAATKSSLCDLCGKAYIDKGTMLHHRQDIHDEVSCEVCHMKFNGARNLRNHTAKSHPERFCFEICSYCGKKFLDKVGLRNHVKLTHEDGKSKKFHCDLCPKSFLYRSALKTHRITVHLKTLDYKCRVCGTGFYDSSARHHHEKREHGFQHKSRWNCNKKATVDD